MSPPQLRDSSQGRGPAPLQKRRSARGRPPGTLSAHHTAPVRTLPAPSAHPRLQLQSAAGELRPRPPAPPGGERGAPGSPPPAAGGELQKACRGGDAGLRQLPTAGAAAALRARTGEDAAQVLPLPSDVPAAGYKNPARGLRRSS